MVALPFFPPLQFIGVVVNVEAMAAGSAIITLAMFTHPLASVTVTL